MYPVTCIQEQKLRRYPCIGLLLAIQLFVLSAGAGYANLNPAGDVMQRPVSGDDRVLKPKE